MPRTAVIIVNFNAGPLLKDCLRSLARQTLRPSRVIIADNASTDDSLSGLEEALPGVEVLRLDKNAGFAAANNAAVRNAADCELIALLNPDAFPEPDWLKLLVESARAHPECSSFASCLVRFADRERLDGAGDAFHVSGSPWRVARGKNFTEVRIKAEEVFSPCAAAALYRRDAYLEAGGFDENLFCFLEDVDLGFRLRLLGHRCLLVPHAVTYHIGSAITGSSSAFAVYHGHRNLVWVWIKNMPWPLLWLYLPQHLLLNLVSMLLYCGRGMGRTILKAKWDALKGVPGVLRIRRRVQATRRVSAAHLLGQMERGILKPYFKRLSWESSDQE